MERTYYLALFAVSLLAVDCHAATFSFTGVFTHDTDIQLFSFTLANPASDIVLRTWSYSGGVNAAGDTISGGGFQPALNLFSADGSQMNPGLSGPCTNPPTGNSLTDLLPDPVTGVCGDVYYPTTLPFPGGTWAAGTYTVALTLDANQAVGPTLADGFFANAVLGVASPGNFTCQSGPLGFQGDPPTAPTDGAFCDEFVSGVERTGNWALDLVNVDSASELAAPESGAGFLVLLGGAAFHVLRRFRSHAPNKPV